MADAKGAVLWTVTNGAVKKVPQRKAAKLETARLRFWDGMYQEWLENPESFAERYLSSNNAANNTPTDFQEPRNDNLPL